ncbi:hypothetical protein [Xanthovirga aplysinae]|uniref:hypothetical protein n=1 Tax=Xanthovirga aplysinae TaxID=2529853 RepID=UPI0012BCA22C|nr:hypothetical protein [Xanthovirga aplysinae]MTI29319.1 hypothetical protein [Xanthovirga aplysinae]
MRFQLTLTLTPKKERAAIPKDYYRWISAWIYRVIAKADKEFSTFLHDTGYRHGANKTFKIFTFSRLDLYPFKEDKKMQLFYLQGNEIRLELAFQIDQASTSIIHGLFLKP